MKKSYSVQAMFNDMRIDRWIRSTLGNIPQSFIEKSLRNGKIKDEEVQDLLTPTTIYSSLVMNLLDEVPILGMAHITGGGICENLPRGIPDGLTANVWYDRYPLKSFKSPDAWHIPNIFYQIVSSGQIIEEEMKNIFNLGIGFCLVVPTKAEIDVHKSIKKRGTRHKKGNEIAAKLLSRGILVILYLLVLF